MSTGPSIVERIKKLLRLARDKAASPAEAANALNRALELIRQHEIDIAGLDLDEPTERLVCEHIHLGERVSLIKFLIAGVLENYFRVRVCISRPKLAVVGFETDVTIAGYVFAFLVRACTQGLKAFCDGERKSRRKVTTLKKESYVRGWIYGIACNLRGSDQAGHLSDSHTALVVAKKGLIEREFDRLFPNTTSSRRPSARKNHDALVTGYGHGRKTTITTPLPGSASGVLLLS
jgi:hypothetical protein